MIGSLGFLTTQRRRAREMFTLTGKRSSQGIFLPRKDATPILPPVYETPIRVGATLVEVRCPGVFGARLPNGKITCAHLAKHLKSEAEGFVPGDRVTLELTPFDFDTARITSRNDPAAGK
jgi:Translation initiation factor 1 (IF-1)